MPDGSASMHQRSVPDTDGGDVTRSADGAARVVAISSGRTGVLHHGSREITTAFVKTSRDGPTPVGVLGIPGDEHVYEHHGGPDMALLVYPEEHYAHWLSVGLDLPDVAAMAENITSRGLLETEVALGDMFRIGSVVVQVSQPRSPCHKLAARYGRRSLPVEMQTTGYTGFLLRVLTEGEMCAGDDIVALGHPGGDRVSVAEAGQIANVNRRDLDGARRLLALDVLGSATRRTLEARVAAGGHDGDDTDRLYLDD